MESKRLKISATQKPSTLNPLINASTSKIIIALITRRNKPKVTIVTGNVKSIRIGLTIRLRIERTTATSMAVPYPATVTPGRKLASKTTTRAVIKILISSFISKHLITKQKCKKSAGKSRRFEVL